MNNDIDAVALATELTVAWLGNANTRTSAAEIPIFMQRMHEAVSELAGPIEAEALTTAASDHTPATTVRKSLASRDHIISMLDGKPYKTLKRHLSTHGLTPDEYRARYGLKGDYPMVAATYSEARQAMAKKIGLGRKPGQKAGDKQAATPTADGRPKGVRAAKAAAKAHLGGGDA